MNKPQIIRDDAGQPAFAVLPWREFERLAGAHRAEEALTDEELFDLAKASDEESFPVEVVQALVDGEHPIAVFCRHRGMRQRHVAEKVGIHLSRPISRRSCEDGGRVRRRRWRPSLAF